MPRQKKSILFDANLHEKKRTQLKFIELKLFNEIAKFCKRIYNLKKIGCFPNFFFWKNIALIIYRI